MVKLLKIKRRDFFQWHSVLIFIDMFAPKWARGPHNLARFPSWDPCITPGYWAWYLNVLPTPGSLFRSLFYAFMSREGTYSCVFCPPPPSSPQRQKPGYAALLRIRENYFRPYLSIPSVCHRGAAYRWKFSYYSGVTHCQKFKLLYFRNERCFGAGNLYKDLFSIYLQPNVYKNS